MQTLYNLIAFVRVADAGSFAEAARRAGTTTSAMSKAVARFERAHGVKLLNRTTHALSPTPEGELLLQGARELLRDAERLKASLAVAGGRGAVGRVRISAPVAFAGACLLPILPGLLHEHPGIDIEISCDDTLVDLAGSGCDLAIRTGEMNGQPGLIARRLLSYPMILCASPAYLARKGTPAAVADLDGHDLIGFRNRANGMLLPWVFASPGGHLERYVPRTRLITDDGSAGWAMILAGVGLGWSPDWLGLDALRAGRVVEIMPQTRMPEVALSVIRLDRRLTPSRIETVLDYLERAAVNWHR